MRLLAGFVAGDEQECFDDPTLLFIGGDGRPQDRRVAFGQLAVSPTQRLFHGHVGRRQRGAQIVSQRVNDIANDVAAAPQFVFLTGNLVVTLAELGE